MMDMTGMARMMGVTPEQLQAAQQTGQHMRMVIKKFRTKGVVEVHYIPTDDQMKETLPSWVDSIAAQVAQGHYTLFGIQGEIQTVKES